MEKSNFLKISGTNIYLFNEYMYLDNSFYQQFYDIESLYMYAKKIQEAFNKIIIFRYFYDNCDIDLIIKRDTTLFQFKEQYNNVSREIDNERRKNKKKNEIDNFSIIKNLIELDQEKVDYVKNKIKYKVLADK